MQDYDLSLPVGRELKEKIDILTYYKKKPTDNTYGKWIRVDKNCAKQISILVRTKFSIFWTF